MAPESDAGLASRDAGKAHKPGVAWPQTDLAFAWHIRDEYVGLKSARDAVADVRAAARRIRAAILNTG